MVFLRIKSFNFKVEKIKNIFFLIRFNSPTGLLFLTLPCFWGVALSTPYDHKDFLVNLGLFFIGAFVMRGAGCVMNDLVDRNLDQKVERTRNRPLANDSLSFFTAILIFVFLCSFGFLIFLKLSYEGKLVSLMAFLLLLIYPWCKRVTYFPQFVLGLAFNAGVIIAYFQGPSQNFLVCILLYSAGIFWTLAYDTIYALQDVEDDQKAGVKSTALFFGSYTPYFLIFCYGMMNSLLLLISYYSFIFYIVVMVNSLLTFRILKTLNLKDKSSCFKKFKENLFLGWVIFVGLVLSHLF